MDNVHLSEIATLLHDAVVDQFKFDAARGRVEIIIWKREENKSVICWQLVISGTINKKDIQRAQFEIDAILVKAKRNSLGFRIDEFSCEKQPAPRRDSVYLVSLSIDHLSPLRVECAKCTLHILDSQFLSFKL